MKTEIRPAQAADLPAVISLLDECRLPSSDLMVANLATFFVAEADGRLMGVIGFEIAGADGLLRSLAVRPEWRGKMLGRHLVARCEAAAHLVGVETIYLLTTTAEAFFSGRDYEEVARDVVPAAIAGHVQFKSLCPASAVCMRKPTREQ